MASTPPTEPDPRTAADDDDDEDATDQGVSSEQPAEGDNGTPAERPGSPQG